MAKQLINVGAVANDGTGDAIRNALIKVNDNTNELYTALGDGSNLNTVVIRTGTPANNQVAVWTADGVIEGDTNLIWDGTNLGIGTASPGAPLDVSSGAVGFILGADNALTTRTNATNKASRIAQPHYTNAEENVTLVFGQSTSSDNIVSIGGGTSSLNSASIISFFTAADQITVIGTERMRIDAAGNVGIGVVTTATTSKLQVFSGAGGRSVFRHASGDGGIIVTGSAGASDASIVFGNTWDSDDGTNFVEEWRIFMEGGDDSLQFKYNADSNTALIMDASGNLDLAGGGYITTLIQVNVQTGTSYTAALTDANAIITMDNGSANVLTLDPFSTIAYPVGFVIEVIQLGAGATTITAGASVELNRITAGSGILTAQDDVVRIRNVAADTWIVSGDIGAIS